MTTGSTIDTASPGLTRYSSLTSRSAATMGVVLVAVSTSPPPAGVPGDGATDVTRIGPGSKTTSPSGIPPVACRPTALCQRCTAAAVAEE
jgi:hypothetical protein